MPKAGSAKGRHEAVAAARVERNKSPHQELRTALSKIDDSCGLAIEIPLPKGGHQRINVTDWLAFPNLYEPLAELATRKLTQLLPGRSREQFIKQLHYGFLAFLQETKRHDFSLTDLSAEVIREFITWLNLRRGAEGDPWERSTKIHYLGAIRQIIDLIPEMRKRRGEIVPHNAFPEDDPDRGGTEPLEDAVIVALLRHALKATADLREVVTNMQRTKELLELSGNRLNCDESPMHCAAILLRRFGTIPERQVLMEDEDLSPRLLSAITKHGYRNIVKCWGPTAQQLMSAVYAIGIQSALNEQTLRDLELQQMQTRKILGFQKLALTELKNRARTRERRSFELGAGEGTIAELLILVKEATSLIRESAPPRLREDLWLFIPRNKGEKGALRSFDTENKDAAFTNAQMAFLKAGGFEFIGFQKLRATDSELVQKEANGDLLLAKALLGHKDPRTTRNHYRSKNEQARGQEALAGAMAQRDRYLNSDGKVDHRGSLCPEQRSSATPGFYCLDPFDSPIIGQTRGVPCAAYGMCPGCNLGTPVTDRPYALARMLQLRDRLEEARDRMSPKEWSAKWMDVMARLMQWIRAYASEEVLQHMKALDLEQIPEIE